MKETQTSFALHDLIYGLRIALVGMLGAVGGISLAGKYEFTLVAWLGALTFGVTLPFTAVLHHHYRLEHARKRNSGYPVNE